VPAGERQPSEFLDKAELKRVSGFGTRAGQLAWLAKEGIPHKLNGKNEVTVSRYHVRLWLEGKELPPQGRINWDALNG
jgi:hypothetical protein